jgi:hypothetical protein
MRICYLSKKQVLTSSHPSNNPKGYPPNYQLLMLISSKVLNLPLKACKNLKSRQICLESYSLPFQATTKLFQAPSKRFQKKT